METPLVPTEMSPLTKKLLFVGAGLVFIFVTVAICLTVVYGMAEYHGGFVIIAISTIILLVCTSVLLNLMRNDKLEGQEKVKLVALAQSFGLVLLSASLFAVIYGPVAASTYTVGGSVSGLVSSAVILNDKVSKANLTILDPTCGPFTFNNKYLSGDSYNVVIAQQPIDGADCTISGASGKVSNKNIATIKVTCTMRYWLGGRCNGLKDNSDGVTLTNQAANRVTVVVTQNGVWNFTDKVTSGTQYNIAVSQQPRNPSQTCSVGAGQGTVGQQDITDIQVVCV